LSSAASFFHTSSFSQTGNKPSSPRQRRSGEFGVPNDADNDASFRQSAIKTETIS
jgi:hypothetical protein